MARATTVLFLCLFLCFGSLLLLFASAADAQLLQTLPHLPQGLACGVSYVDVSIGFFSVNITPVVNGTCNGVPTLLIRGAGIPPAPGFALVFSGDVGEHSDAGFYHQELAAGLTFPAVSDAFVLPKGTACGLHHTENSPGHTCMGFNPAQAPEFPDNPEPMAVRSPLSGCPLGWTARRAFDMSSTANYWVWCEYDDPHHLSIGNPQVETIDGQPVVGIACGISHNAPGMDPGPVCMGYRPVEGTSPLCPSSTTGYGWFDSGRPSGLGLGFCATTAGTIPSPAPARGYLDTTISTDGAFGGWAYDPNAPADSIFVDVYLDGPAGSGTPLFRITANGARPDVDSAFHIGGNHGYSFVLPSQFLSTSHTVYVYGISEFGQPNMLLTQAPGRYSAPAPDPPPRPICRGCLPP